MKTPKRIIKVSLPEHAIITSDQLASAMGLTRDQFILRAIETQRLETLCAGYRNVAFETIGNRMEELKSDFLALRIHLRS